MSETINGTEPYRTLKWPVEAKTPLHNSRETRAHPVLTAWRLTYTVSPVRRRQKMHDSHAMSQVRERPGPRDLPLLGTTTPFIGKDLLRTFGGLIAEHGPPVGVHLPFGHRLVKVAHRDGVEQVLRSGRENYVKGSVYDGVQINWNQSDTHQPTLFKRRLSMTRFQAEEDWLVEINHAHHAIT